jgi:hypothetical protein
VCSAKLPVWEVVHQACRKIIYLGSHPGSQVLIVRAMYCCGQHSGSACGTVESCGGEFGYNSIVSSTSPAVDTSNAHVHCKYTSYHLSHSLTDQQVRSSTSSYHSSQSQTPPNQMDPPTQGTVRCRAPHLPDLQVPETVRESAL